jgi:hypothetical protein
MDERAARAAVLVRAIESADGAREIWSDADRVAAGRAAAETVGEAASEDRFIARRAVLVLERLAERYPKTRILAGVASLRGWLAPLGAAIAFVLGAAGVDIGPGHRINLLAPPVLALLAWNLAVYGALAAAALRGRHDRAPGPLRRRIGEGMRHLAQPRGASGAPPALAAALARFAVEWPALAAPLWQQRAARILHVCAATLAAGAIAGLYMRGIALEYRASWQSTFLDAAAVARLLRVVLAPGSWLTGIAVPGADRLGAIGAGSAGENAAAWIHLYAATILIVVIAPRLALAALAGLRERRLAQRFPLALDHTYFRRLLHAWHEGTTHVLAVPYSFDVPRTHADALARMMTRVFQCAVDVAWRPSVPYGDDDAPALPASPLAAVVAVFSLSATPERENHGAFLAALAARAAGRAPVIAVVDTSEFAARFHDQPARIAERQAAWRQLCAPFGEPLFVRLAHPDLAEAAAVLTMRLEHATP